MTLIKVITGLNTRSDVCIGKSLHTFSDIVLMTLIISAPSKQLSTHCVTQPIMCKTRRLDFNHFDINPTCLKRIRESNSHKQGHAISTKCLN